jgi:hypothetical protein
MFQGGGGLNGTVADPIGAQGGGIPALARGFAVITSDTGHKVEGEALMPPLWRTRGLYELSLQGHRQGYCSW